MVAAKAASWVVTRAVSRGGVRAGKRAAWWVELMVSVMVDLLAEKWVEMMVFEKVGYLVVGLAFAKVLLMGVRVVGALVDEMETLMAV